MVSSIPEILLSIYCNLLVLLAFLFPLWVPKFFITRFPAVWIFLIDSISLSVMNGFIYFLLLFVFSQAVSGL